MASSSYSNGGTGTTTGGDDDPKQGKGGGGSSSLIKATTITSSTSPTTTTTTSPTSQQQQQQQQSLLLKKLPKGILESPEEEEALETVKRNFTKGSCIGFLLYVSLSLGVLKWAPRSSFILPEEREFRCYIAVGCLVVVTNVSRFLRLLVTREERVVAAVRHGILSGILLLQCITVTSSFAMAFVPSPVIYDRVTGHDFRLFHWVEWISLCFLMTFLVDNIDGTGAKAGGSGAGGGPKYARAWSVCLSAAAALVLPFCPNRATWMVVMVISCILFIPLYTLMFTRTMRYLHVQRRMACLELKSASDEESYEMARSSFLLTLTCATCWTILVATFLVICLAPQHVPLRASEMEYVMTLHYCFMEVISKNWYLTVLIDAYERVFDVNVRLARRMEELRRFMSVVWEFSSDVIVFSYKQSDDRYSARISPAFLNIFELPKGFLDLGSSSSSSSAAASRGGGGQEVSLLLEITPSEGHFYVFAIDLSRPIDRYDVSRFKTIVKGERLSLRTANDPKANPGHRNLAIIADLIVTTFQMQNQAVGQEIVCVKHFHMIDSAGNQKEKRCEAKISLLKDGQAVIAMRDISDRLEKFEAEKRLVEECAIKKKDAEANQFSELMNDTSWLL
jgi:hypothetical protein